jgi:hypothetical protein
MTTTINPTTITTTTSLSTTTTNPLLLIDSTILTSDEETNLQSLAGFTGSLLLLWRGTRDGFDASTFHSKCDGKTNTITIIKSTLDYVFGGYASIAWDSTSGYKTDSNAYLFSLRVNGTSTSIKYPIIYTQYAICCFLGWGPHFGAGYDISVLSNSNTNNNSYTRCHSYQCPSGVYKYSHHSKFTGSDNFQVSEIEVFQIV